VSVLRPARNAGRIARVALTAESPPGVRRWELAPAALAAAGVLILHVLLSGRYGFHRDELATIAAGRHPSLGYVDRGPVMPLATRAVMAVTGTHLFPLRVLAGAAHAGVVVVAGLLTRAFGGRQPAIGLAVLGAALAPVFLAAGSLFLAPVFDLLWWSLAIYVVTRLLAGADPRWWLAVGGLVGIGLETRVTMALLAVGLAVGLAAVPEGRRLLAGPWPWAGAALALGLWLPNLVWQALNGWPLTDLAAGARDDVGDAGGLGYSAVRQVFQAGPVGLALVLLGIVVLARRPPFRVLAVTMVVVTVANFAAAGRPVYLAPLYVVGLAAGAVGVGDWVRFDRRRWQQVATGLALAGVVALPAVTPLVPPHAYGDIFLDVDGDIGEEVGWPDMVDLVVMVRRAVPVDRRADLKVVTAGAGEAAAIDLYGPARGLAPGTALSPEGSYATWWPDDAELDTVIFVRYPRSVLTPFCHVLGPLAVVGNDEFVDNRAQLGTITLCRRLSIGPAELRRVLAAAADGDGTSGGGR
jgi:Dolichyl-phosphate-mannose-protein mannosyltransferase